jgi:ribosomal protein S18 acetylase RimI-like enzyme
VNTASPRGSGRPHNNLQPYLTFYFSISLQGVFPTPLVAMRVALRPVRDADEPFLLRVYAGTRAEELAPVPWTAEQKAAFVGQQFAAQTAHYAQHYAGMRADVILVDDVPAGRLPVARWAEEIRIVDISILPELRGRGAGSIVLRGLLDEATAAGKRLSIHVERENRALGLSERLGFRRVGEHGVYLRMECDPADAQAGSPRRQGQRSLDAVLAAIPRDDGEPLTMGDRQHLVRRLDGNATSVPGAGASVNPGSACPNGPCSTREPPQNVSGIGCSDCTRREITTLTLRKRDSSYTSGVLPSWCATK